MVQAAEHLICKGKALSSNSSPTKNKQKTKNQFYKHLWTKVIVPLNITQLEVWLK
jgi:hypothetical protein